MRVRHAACYSRGGHDQRRNGRAGRVYCRGYASPLQQERQAGCSPGMFVPNTKRKVKRLVKKDTTLQEREEKEIEAFEALHAHQAQENE